MVDKLDEPFPQIILDFLDELEIKNFIKSIDLNIKKRRRFSIFQDLLTIIKGKFMSIFNREVIIDIMYDYFYSKLNMMGYHTMGLKVCLGTFFDILNKSEDWNWLYNMLYNKESKETLVKVVKLRVLSLFLSVIKASEIIKFKFNYRLFLKFLQAIGEFNLRNLIFSRVKGKIWFPRFYRLNGYLVLLKPLNMFEVFFIETYKYKNIIVPKKGDIVLDIGAGFGDTPIWFAKYIGKSGKIYAFEPETLTYETLRYIIDINNLKQLVEALKYKAGSYSSKFEKNSVDNHISIDDFIESRQLHRVDFIKLDVEGDELNVLKGASNTIKSFSPKIVIGSYHYARELIDVAKYLKKLNSNYKLYLKHDWFLWHGTNIFAI